MFFEDSESIRDLIHHIYFGRIYAILPCKSSMLTCSEVEALPFYLSCRSLILNIGVTYGLDCLIEETLNLVDDILKGQVVISNKVKDPELSSILVLLRLLSDSIEYYWDYVESNYVKAQREAHTNNNTARHLLKSGDIDEDKAQGNVYYDVNRKIITNSIIGYSVLRAGFHQVQPSALNRSVAIRLMNSCAKLKFNSRNLKIINNMCLHLFSNTDSLMYQSILPEYQAYLRERGNENFVEMFEVAINHIFRFAAASNPDEYFEFIDANLKRPFHMYSGKTHRKHLKFVSHFDLLGFAYVTRQTLPRLLNLIKDLLSATDIILFDYLTLFFSSKSLLFWVMARPQEYIMVYNGLRSSESRKTDPYARELFNMTSSLFDDVYSHFNVSSMLTSTSSSSSSSATTDSAPMNNQAIYVTTPMSAVTATNFFPHSKSNSHATSPSVAPLPTLSHVSSSPVVPVSHSADDKLRRYPSNSHNKAASVAPPIANTAATSESSLPEKLYSVSASSVPGKSYFPISPSSRRSPLGTAHPSVKRTVSGVVVPRSSPVSSTSVVSLPASSTNAAGGGSGDAAAAAAGSTKIKQSSSSESVSSSIQSPVSGGSLNSLLDIGSPPHDRPNKGTFRSLSRSRTGILTSVKSATSLSRLTSPRGSCTDLYALAHSRTHSPIPMMSAPVHKTVTNGSIGSTVTSSKDHTTTTTTNNNNNNTGAGGLINDISADSDYQTAKLFAQVDFPPARLPTSSRADYNNNDNVMGAGGIGGDRLTNMPKSFSMMGIYAPKATLAAMDATERTTERGSGSPAYLNHRHSIGGDYDRRLERTNSTISRSCFIHLENILDFYIHFDDNESLPHTSVLRFLTCLLMLDSEVFMELNSQSFKNVPDTQSLPDSYCLAHHLRDSQHQHPQRHHHHYSRHHHDISSDNNYRAHSSDEQRIDAEDIPETPLNKSASASASASVSVSATTSTNTPISANSDRERDKSLHSTHKRRISLNLKKITNLPLSRRKSVRYMQALVKNLSGAQNASDPVLVDSVKSLFTLYIISSCASLVNADLPSVIFCRRLMETIGVNLGIGEDWNPKVRVNTRLRRALEKLPMSLLLLQIKFFSASMQLDHEYFLKRLHLNKQIELMDFQVLNHYTEGFRIFFHLLTPETLRMSIAYETANFFKSLLSVISDILLQTCQTDGDWFMEVICSILDGTLLEKLTLRREYGVKEGTDPVSAVSSELSGANTPLRMGESELLGRQSPNFVNNGIRHSMDLQSALQQPESVDPMDSRDLKTTTLDSPTNEADLESATSFSASDIFAGPSNTIRDSVYSTSSSKTLGLPVKGMGRKFRRHSDIFGAKERASSTSAGVVESGSLYKSNSNGIFSDINIFYWRQIMINIFNTFRRMTNYFISTHSEATDLSWVAGDFQSLVKPVFVGIIQPDEALQSAAQSFIEVVVDYIKETSIAQSSTALQGFTLLSTHMLSLFSIGLFDLDVSPEKRTIILDVITELVALRSHLISLAQGTPAEEGVIDIERSTFPVTLGTVGRGLFSSLMSNDRKVQKLVIAATFSFNGMVESYNKHCGPVEPELLPTTELFKLIAQDSVLLSAGSVAFQRRVRTTLLNFKQKPDSIMCDCVDNMFRKWDDFAKMKKTLSATDMSDFRNIAGILASISGDFLSLDPGSTDGTTPLSGRFLEFVESLKKKINYFIYKQCQWLNHRNLLLRENARDILSFELHALSFKILFDHIKLRVEEIMLVDFTLPENESAFILLEQIPWIMRCILSRENIDKVIFLSSTDIVEVINKLVVVVKRMPSSSPKFYKAVIHMSRMFSALRQSEKHLVVCSCYYLKNKWLEVAMNWFHTSILKEYNIENLSKPHREMNLAMRDLDFLYIDAVIESSRAISYLAENVPLEVSASTSEEEYMRSKTMLFGNYFNILLKGLEKSMDSERFTAALKHKMNVLNENVILALTNLSKANVEVSFQFTIPMGYSFDKNIKIAFLKVFTSMLQSYKQKMEDKRKEKHIYMDKLVKLCITHPILTVYAARMCPASDIDSYAAVMVNGWGTRNASHLVVGELVKDEIQRSFRPSDILRRNSVASRALTFFTKDKGSEYLIKTLRPTLQVIADNHHTLNIEKVQPSSENAKDIVNVFLTCITMLVDAITSSVDDFPEEFSYICQIIYTEALKKFPDYALIAVGSFVFLRFICPALVSPETENIVELPTTSEKRPFLSLAKVLQSLANGSSYTLKWPALDTKSQFLRECSDKIFDFLKEVSRPDRKIHIDMCLTGAAKPFDHTFLHSYLYFDLLKIRKHILSLNTTIDDQDKLLSVFMEVDDIMAHLGEPQMLTKNEIPEIVRDHSQQYPGLYEFMSRISYRNFGDLNDAYVIVRESLSATGIPSLIFCYKRYASSKIDLEASVFILFQVYARMWSSKHYFVFDCTAFTEEIVDVKRFTTTFLSLVPKVAPKNCAGVYIINVNRSFVDNWEDLFAHNNIYLRYKVPHFFVNTSSDVEVLKPMKLGGQISELLEDVRVSLHDLTLYDGRLNEFVPVSLKIGNQNFQVLYERSPSLRIKILDKIRILKINATYKIADIISVDVSPNSGPVKRFFVHMTNKRTLIFESPKYLEIVKMFEFVISRQAMEYSEAGALVARGGRPGGKNDTNDLIGHLILFVMVGLFSDDNLVKNLSYNMLVAAEEAFDLRFGLPLHNMPELYIPTDVMASLSTIMESLSAFYPELTYYVWKYVLEGLENNVIPTTYVPQSILILTYWIPNLYQYVYRLDYEGGEEAVSKIIRSLIKLTVADSPFTTIYVREIWSLLPIDGRLTSFLVDEIVNHCLERDSENKDWMGATVLLTSFPTVEVVAEVVQKLINCIISFLPSLKVEASTQSWSEISILVRLSIYLFYEATFMAQMFLPEVLFVIALLIDVGPLDLRQSLHELLMNICGSLVISPLLTDAQRKELDNLIWDFTRHKPKFMLGFNQFKSSIMPNFPYGSFSSRINTLDIFVTNVLKLMNYGPVRETAHWKERFVRCLSDIVIKNDSFLSARAMMVLGICRKNSASHLFCKSLLIESAKVFAIPNVTDEVLFSTVIQGFTYSKIVEGLDPSTPLLKQLFWLSVELIYSPIPTIFESGLVLMTSCIRRLYDFHFSSGIDRSTIIAQLLEVKNSLSPFMNEIERAQGTMWNKENFVIIVMSFINRGLLTPFIKPNALESLKECFRLGYKEYQRFPDEQHYVGYIFLLFLVCSPEQFIEVLQNVGFEGEMVNLDSRNKFPVSLVEWLTSESDGSIAAFYQGAMLFKNRGVEDSTKMRLLLVINYILNINPHCVFRFYGLIREEFRMSTALQPNAVPIPAVFEIIRKVFKHEEYSHLDYYVHEMEERLTKSGLKIVIDTQSNDVSLDSLLKTLLEHPEVLQNRKRHIVQTICRIVASMGD